MEEKIRTDDEGSLSFRIFVKDNHIILHWGKPVTWIGLHKEQVKILAEKLLEYENLVSEVRD